MMVAIVVLLVVLVVLEAVVAWSLLRPLMALGRILEAGASVAESGERIASAVASRASRVDL